MQLLFPYPFLIPVIEYSLNPKPLEMSPAASKIADSDLGATDHSAVGIANVEVESPGTELGFRVQGSGFRV